MYFKKNVTVVKIGIKLEVDKDSGIQKKKKKKKKWILVVKDFLSHKNLHLHPPFIGIKLIKK